MILRNKIILCAIALCMMLAVFGPESGTRCFAMSDVLPVESQLMLEIGMSATPEELVEPGEVILNFTVTNISDEGALNLYLSTANGLASEPIGQLAAGETHSFTRSHSVTEAELEAGEISYIVSHDAPLQGDTKVDYTINTAILRAVARPQVEFTRQLSSQYVSAGNTLAITYRIRNTGNVALNTLQVHDVLGDFTGRIDRLDVGESRTLINRVTINADAVSSAALSYLVDSQGDIQHNQTLADTAVYLAHAQLDASLSAGLAAFSTDSAEVVLLLTNEGNVDFRDITISDDIHGGVIADNVRVPSGSDPVEVFSEYPLRETSDFRWRISGTSETGERIDFITDTITLEPAEITESPQLKIRAETATPRIRRAGTVEIAVHIINEGNSAAKDVLLSEPTLGEIRNFAAIPPAGEIVRTLDVDIKEDTQFNFRLDYLDINNWMLDAEAEELSIAIAPDGVLLEGTKAPLIEFTGASIKIGGSSLFAWLLITGFAVLLILIIILLVATRKAKLEKRMRIAAEKQRRKEEMGKTNRFKPVRKKK